MAKSLSLEEQVAEAVQKLKGLFGNEEPTEIGPPKNATVESLWAELCALRKEVYALKKVKRGVRPNVEKAVKLILEDPELAQIPVPMIAEIIRGVWKVYGLPCKTSEQSIRWYMSRKSLEWKIVRRAMPPIKGINDDDNESG